MDTLWQDFRYGVRMLTRSPGFTAVAVIVLALGIGANTAVFSVVNATLLRPLPFKDPHRLVGVYKIQLQKGLTFSQLSPVDFGYLRDHSQVFEQIAALLFFSFNLTGSGEPEQIGGAFVSADFFPLLGVQPLLGRFFLAEEDQPGRNRVVILSRSLWQQRFGSDPGIVGKTLTLNDESFTVVGIVSLDIASPLGGRADLWVPLALVAKAMTNTRPSLWVRARLKPGIRLEQAQAEMSALARQLEEQYPEPNRGWDVKLSPLQEMYVGEIRPTLLVLLAAIGFVLLMACANVANLLLARATDRQKEIAIRVALGASRLRLIRQLLTESLLLAVLGGAVGLLVAFQGTEFLMAMKPLGDLHQMFQMGIDGHVLSFTSTVSLLTGMIFGVVPAWQASRPNLNESLKEGGGTSTGGVRRQRSRQVLVVFEVALALLLLIGAGLMLKSFLRLRGVDPGFNPHNLLTMKISLPTSKYRERRQIAAFYQQVLQRIKTLPGVKSVGAAFAAPFSKWNAVFAFTIEGRPAPAPGEVPEANFRVVSPDYFQAIGIPLLRGRHFTEGDTPEAPGVIIINEALARRFWPNEDPLGHRMKLEGEEGWRLIVGVVRDVKHWGLDQAAEPEMYVPYLQRPWRFMILVVRTVSDPVNLAGAVREQVWAVDKDQPVAEMKTMEQLLEESVSQPHFSTFLLGVFAALGVILAAVGVYGVISYSVIQRTHEIGIRMALGAQPKDILRLVLGQGLKLTVVGIGIGLLGAFAVTRFLRSLLYGISPTDPMTFAGASLLLGGVALAACYIPARRAMRVDPMLALRYE